MYHFVCLTGADITHNVYLMNWLKIAVGKIGRHLTHPNLLLHVALGQLLPLGLHGQADQVVGADGQQLLSLLLLGLGFHHQQWNGQQN